jgi:hypothetical protein
MWFVEVHNIMIRTVYENDFSFSAENIRAPRLIFVEFRFRICNKII